MLDIVPTYHPMQFQLKLMNQTWENGKNLILGLILAYLAPPKILLLGFISTRCSISLQAIIVCNFKEN